MNKCKSPEGQNSSPSSSPKLAENPQQTSPLPLITVAHPSKLMSLQESEPKRQRNKVQKKTKKRSNVPSCTSTNKNLSADMPQDLRIRHTPTDFERLSDEKNKTKTEEVSRFNQTQYFCNSEAANHRKLLDSLVPPPTILVPYPLILPLPLPIPIPIPLPFPNGFLSNEKDEEKSKDASSQTDENSSQNVSVEKTEVSFRPLRKRKRIVEKKTKFLIKNKKILST